MRKILLGFALLLVICVGLYLRVHHAKPPIEIGFAGNRQVTLMSTTAQVREPVAVVNFGDRLEILQRFQDQVQVRTMKGVVGWINERDLLSADLWQKAHDLETKVAAMPAMAHGHTKALTNLHISAGREALRLRQLSKTIPLELYERQTVEVPTAPRTVKAGDQEESGAEPPQAKKEDWWLVRAQAPDQTAISGWILGRFVQLDVPAPLADYASSANMRIVAWFELSHVNDAAGHEKPQFLVLGAHGPEGQPCDFSMLRVYTWGVQRQRYETAFVESNVCGKLPVKVTKSEAAGSDVTFAFRDLGDSAGGERTYQMHQTIVRRVREGGKPVARKRH
ncbi:MAG: hypothetical protein WB780_10230 [Candidatus Acidiferrales bacterium]